jgi:predicted nucleic acid-binding protein
LTSTSPPPNALVFDTGPLRHFAVQGWLRVLDFLAEDRPVIIPESVERELRDQAHALPVLNEVLDAEWIVTDRSCDLAFVAAFARYEERLVAGGANRGECGVLALGRVRGYELVLDDAVPRTIAEEEGLLVTATVPLLCRAVRESKLTLTMVEKVADDLLAGQYHLPFGPGGFRRHALENGLVEYPVEG